MKVRSETLNQCFGRYLMVYENSNMLRIFLCIGVYVWIVLIICGINLVRRNRVGCFLTFPVLAVTAILLVATPEYSEFRYAYSVFCTLPSLIYTLLMTVRTDR